MSVIAGANDTIAAIATPPGIGGISVLRISGPKATDILSAIFRARSGERIDTWPSHRLTLGWAGERNNPVDEAMAVVMRAPRSYTKEDVAEIHCHGSRWTSGELVRLAINAGARPAAPGEFTRRAFENGRIDLTQAEAVMTLIGAESERAAREALKQMNGGASKEIKKRRDELIHILAEIEASLDFPEDMGEEAASASLRSRITAIAASLRAACNPRAEKLFREGFEVVITGKPNAGKSTLLNYLLGEERAIVSSIPGATRDSLTEKLALDGLVINITDTAGVRSGEGNLDELESKGARKTREALERADLLLIVLDSSAPLQNDDYSILYETRENPRIVALNKSDMPSAIDEHHVRSALHDGPDTAKAKIIKLSSLTGQGINELLDALRGYAVPVGEETAPLARRRHIEAAQKAAAALEEAAVTLKTSGQHDLAAVDIRAALDSLGAITGENLYDDVVDTIFSAFCIGK